MKVPATTSSTAIIWIMSFSETAASDVVGQIRPVVMTPSHSPRLVATALVTEAAEEVLRDDTDVCAVVFVLERAGFAQARYVEMLCWCVARIMEREEFRLYVVCRDMTPRDLGIARSDKGLEALKQLIDTVQITDTASIEQTGRHVAAHVASLEETQKQVEWNRIRAVATKLIGWASASVQVLCVAVAVALVFWGLMWDGKVELFLFCFPLWHGALTLGPYAGLEPQVALVCGIAGMPFVLLLLYVYTRYGLMLRRVREDHFGILYSGVASFAAPYILCLPFELHAPIPWLVLGLMIGFMLDAARRNIYLARREQQPVTPTTVTLRHGRLPERLSRQAGATWIHPLRCPLLPVRQARVFISYTRGSAWAHRVETALVGQLKAVGARVFTDKGIRDGESWRRALNRELGQCTVFVSLADPSSVERTWPAAEAEAALVGRDLTGLPEMIVIRAPDLPAPDGEAWRWLPVYREVLDVHEDRRETAPKILDYGDATTQAVIFRLHPKFYRSVSVVPLTLSELLRKLWVIPGMMVSSWGCLGVWGGYSAFVLLALELLLKVDISGWLRSHGCLGAAFLGCAVWLGYTTRLMLAACYQLRRKRWTNVTATHRNSVIGLVALLVVWSSMADPLVIGWAVVMTVASYLEADAFCDREARRDPKFLRGL